LKHLDSLERELNDITGEDDEEAVLPEGDLRDLTNHFQNHLAQWKGARNSLSTKDAGYSKFVEIEQSMSACVDLTA